MYVYVVDTGVDAKHPEFEGRVTAGYSTIEGENATEDTNAHGTHVAGIIASRTYGVAKAATVVPVKVFPAEGGGASRVDIVEGINWVISQRCCRRGRGWTACRCCGFHTPSYGE